MKIFIFAHPNTQEGFEVKKDHLRQIKSVSNEVSLIRDVKEAEVVITHSLSTINLKSIKNLKWIHLTSAGVGQISDELKKSQIIITNSSGVHPVPIAEQVFGYMLMFARGLNMALRAQNNNKWSKEIEVFELQEKTILIVGLGKIGLMIARLAKSFRMQVLGVVRKKERRESHVDRVIPSQELDQVLGDCDFVINCLPGTEETHHLFNSARFNKFKKGSYFINIGRGSSVEEKALIKSLNLGKIAGAGLDVFEEEPLPKSSPLWRMENVIITPHTAGHTPFYMDRVIEIFVDNLENFLKGRGMANLVNKELGIFFNLNR